MDRQIWKNPLQCKALNESEVPLWFWNDALEDEELIRQLKLKSEMGITATIPHARTNNGEGYIGGYLDEDWFHKHQVVLDYKKDHDETMWLYDEIDWPAGTCHQTLTREEALREKYLRIEKTYVSKGQVFRAQLYSLIGKVKFDLKADDDIRGYGFNIFVVDAATKELCDLREFLLDEMFGVEFELHAIKDYEVYRVSIVMDPYEHGGKAQINYLDNKATEAFIASTYELYNDHFGDDFGTQITSVFNDETRMAHSMPWVDSFETYFYEQKGYSILDQLYLLIEEGDRAGRLRCDYYDVVASLYQKHYFKKLYDWCTEHQINFYAHLLGEETIHGHARYSGDFLRQYRYMHIAGVDHLGKGIGSLNMKYCSAGAHSYGIARSAVEIFAGCGWDMTFEEYCKMITWVYQMGVQGIINHGFFYSTRGERKNDWPPSQFFQWQGWDRMQDGNVMIRRLSYALTDGMNEMDILLYHPMETFWYYYQPEQYFTHGFFKGPILEGKAGELDYGLQLLMNSLLERNLDFDLIHKDALENFEVEGCSIKNNKTGQIFKHLIIPYCEVIPYELVEIIDTFVENGGKLYVLGHLPNMCMPMVKEEDMLTRIRDIGSRDTVKRFEPMQMNALMHCMAQEVDCPITIVKGTNSNTNSHSHYDNYLIDPYIHTGEKIEGILYNRYVKEGYRHTVFMNYSSTIETIHVRVVTGQIPEIWNPMTGEIEKATVISRTDTDITIQLELGCDYGKIIVSSL